MLWYHMIYYDIIWYYANNNDVNNLDHNSDNEQY